MDERHSFAVVGAGALASALAPALAAAGLKPVGVASRGQERAAALARRLGCATFDTASLPRADYLAICVTDSAIGDVAQEAARSGRTWDRAAVFHTSGSIDVEVLDPFRRLGAVCFGFHPIQTVVYPGKAADLAGTTVGLGGSEEGRAEGARLASRLGLAGLEVPDHQRGLYHLGTALASNGVVTLASVARQCLESCGIPSQAAEKALGPLIEASARNASALGPERALSGPVVRGDADTVVRHLRGLADSLPDLVPLYAALSAETARLAVQSGRLDREVAIDLLSSIAAALRPGARTGGEEP